MSRRKILVSQMRLNLIAFVDDELIDNASEVARALIGLANAADASANDGSDEYGDSMFNGIEVAVA